jgi:hypothetical protein
MEMPDKYFKQMLDQASTPYDPVFWDSARAFIAREERKRKRRVFMWWFSSVTVLMGVAAFTWAFFIRDAAEITAGPFASGVPARSSVQSISSADLVSDISSSNHEALLENSHDKALSTPSDSQRSNNTKTISEANGIDAPVENNSMAAKTTNRDKSGQKNYTEKRTERGQFPSINADSDEKWQESPLVQTQVSDKPSENNLELTSTHPVGLPFRIQEAEQTLPMRKTSDLVQRVQVKKHKFNGFLSTSAMFNPAWRNDQLFTLGFSAGGGMQYTYGEKWNLRTGLSYLHRWGTFDVMLDHPTPIYGFVKNDKGYTLVPTDAAYLDMPVSLGYSFGKVQAGAGITVMRLLGAKGKVFSYEGTPAENDPGTLVYRSSQISSGWIETPGFKNWILNYQLYLEYPLSKRTYLGCRLDYISSGLVKENYQYFYQHETGSYEWKRASGLLENNYQWHIYIHYTL